MGVTHHGQPPAWAATVVGVSTMTASRTAVEASAKNLSGSIGSSLGKVEAKGVHTL